MPKRKLSELNGPARPDARKLSMKAIRLTHKFEQGVQVISKSLKTARGFERQKLSRREKTAKSQNDSATLSRLAEEVEALKGIEYHVTAERYLFKQLSKIKRIAELSAFKEFQESKNVSISGPKSTAEANVLARLFKSNPVKNVLPGILGDIRKLMGLEEAPPGNQSKAGENKDVARREKAARQQKEESGSESEDDEQQERRSSNIQHSEQVSDAEDMAESEEDFSQLDSRLAPGSGSEDEDDESSDEDVPAPDSEALADDISDSVSRSPSPAFSAENSPPPKKTKASKASAAPAAQSTTFLPSLMMGGYWSGSEEASEDEETAGPPQRKNRMGQQARRALWEKKFGSKANHVQQEKKQQKRNRDSGWDTRRGATEGGGRGSKAAGRGGFGAGGGRPQNRREDHSGSSQGGKPKHPSKETGPLHPSWEAKRKLKEQSSTAAFQGKKVTFD